MLTWHGLKSNNIPPLFYDKYFHISFCSTSAQILIYCFKVFPGVLYDAFPFVFMFNKILVFSCKILITILYKWIKQKRRKNGRNLIWQMPDRGETKSLYLRFILCHIWPSNQDENKMLYHDVDAFWYHTSNYILYICILVRGNKSLIRRCIVLTKYSLLTSHTVSYNLYRIDKHELRKKIDLETDLTMRKHMKIVHNWLNTYCFSKQTPNALRGQFSPHPWLLLRRSFRRVLQCSRPCSNKFSFLYLL